MNATETMNTCYIVAATKPWNQRIFNEVISKYPGLWEFISDPEELTIERITELSPRYIFFLHWSWKVPSEIVNDYECVCFHMTNVPYGRGGSPLQNLIIRGHRDTVLTALRMVDDYDAGPIYCKDVLLLDGNAEEIYIRGSYTASSMIQRIIDEQLEPKAQIGEPVVFDRRKPFESEIPEASSLRGLYDFIRMLDAEGYPHAFLDYGGFRYEFRRAAVYEGRILADVTITTLSNEEGKS